MNRLCRFLAWLRGVPGISPAQAPEQVRAPAPISTWAPDLQRIATHPRRELAPPQAPVNPKQLNLHWIIPDAANKSGGGHMSIFRHVRFLEAQGHQQTLWLRPPWFHNSPEEALATFQAYQPLGAAVEVRFLPDDPGQISGDAVIATDWWTAYPALAVSHVHERFYVVQDFEPQFQPMGAGYLLAENTYRFGFNCLCGGNWLAQRLRDDYGCWTRAWPLAYDPEIYFSQGSISTKPDAVPRIAFYYRPSTPRRAVELALAAFELLHAQGLRFSVDFFGEPLAFTPAYSYQDHGVLTPPELADLYRAVDFGVVFSATNYSLIPLEMMACGLPVVELDMPGTRAVFPAGTTLSVAPDPVKIAAGIQSALSEPGQLVPIRQAAAAHVATRNWSASCTAFEQALIEGLTS